MTGRTASTHREGLISPLLILWAIRGNAVQQHERYKAELEIQEVWL
jgi:hypothetical protein